MALIDSLLTYILFSFCLKAFPFLLRCLISHQTARAKFTLSLLSQFFWGTTMGCIIILVIITYYHDYNNLCHDAFMDKVYQLSWSNITIMIVMTIVKMNCSCTWITKWKLHLCRCSSSMRLGRTASYRELRSLKKKTAFEIQDFWLVPIWPIRNPES